jgi:hypothetical protein
MSLLFEQQWLAAFPSAAEKQFRHHGHGMLHFPVTWN